VQLVTAPHTPVPFARELERAYVPSPTRIEAAIRAVMKD
jgi:pyruvate dehydrogenase E1 component beta subunit